MTRSSLLLVAILTALLLSGCVPMKELQSERMVEFRESAAAGTLPFPVPPGTKVDSVTVHEPDSLLTVFFSREFSYDAFRPDNVRRTYSSVRSYFQEVFEDYRISVKTQNRQIEELIPNFFRTDTASIDRSRLPRPDTTRPLPVTRNISKPFAPSRGLQSRNIVLWHSHGWYYDRREQRWMWQRPRLFQTVEDLVPMSFTLPYLIPMLENGGATVFVPRERDVQLHEVVVDNDDPGAAYLETGGSAHGGWTTGPEPAFASGTPPYADNTNPFRLGTARTIFSDTIPTASATWIPTLADSGEYAVTISYCSSPTSVRDARYTVFHLGGRTEFRVNQQIAGRTWVYLGTFRFAKGSNPATGRVVLTNASNEVGKVVSADATRFGGGMGVVARAGGTSGRPKFVEGARYYLQYAGMPDTLVYSLTRGRDDYTDDYLSRPEYANYLRGSPGGPNRDRSAAGLGVPVDLTLAFHTDAGITSNDTTIGTLSIFSTTGADTSDMFPDSVSRMASRDFADILQTQIVQDIRVLHDPTWQRRQLMDAARYAEARLPNVPGALLELLSHQNFLDMRYMLDPRFRFTVARSIYKGILRFLTFQHGIPAVVQPLPVSHFAAEFTKEGDLLLRWRPVEDPLEPTAVPKAYIVYTRIGNGGFDNGTLVRHPSYIVGGIKPGTIYSFAVTAVNDGGESMRGEILSVCSASRDAVTALIVNGFDRISGPDWIEGESFSGLLNFQDAGVGDRYTFNFTGSQYDYDPRSPFVTNDSPGHGASHAYNEGKVIGGNSFDYPALHGRSLLAAGLSFVSCSRDAVTDTMVSLSKYPLVDLILGKQKLTRRQKPELDSLLGEQFEAFPPSLRTSVAQYCSTGGNLFVSGAYVASDLARAGKRDSTALQFSRNVLRFDLGTVHASRWGDVYSPSPTFLPGKEWRAFASEAIAGSYGVESVDELTPANGGTVILRYRENEFTAGVAYKGSYGVVAFGFPFETILEPARRDDVMKGVVGFLLGR